MSQGNDKIRIDKWLWAVRVFKTRSVATLSCNAGKIKINGDSVKPSKLIGIGDIITVQKDYTRFTFKVKNVIEKRISASLVPEYLVDQTPVEELIIKKEIMKSAFFRPKGTGRPTKKERRDIDRLNDAVD